MLQKIKNIWNSAKELEEAKEKYKEAENRYYIARESVCDNDSARASLHSDIRSEFKRMKSGEIELNEKAILKIIEEINKRQLCTKN